MAAALITPVDWSTVHNIPRVLRVNKVTQNDWIFTPDIGLVNPTIQNYAGTVGTFTFGTATITNGSTAYTATTESIAVVGAPVGIYIAQFPFYVETSSGEIMQVLSTSSATATGGTWTVQRGCLGTTASATGLAHTNTLYIKNVLTLTDAGTGYVYITYDPLPNDPKVKMFE